MFVFASLREVGVLGLMGLLGACQPVVVASGPVQPRLVVVAPAEKVYRTVNGRVFATEAARLAYLHAASDPKERALYRAELYRQEHLSTSLAAQQAARRHAGVARATTRLRAAKQDLRQAERDLRRAEREARQRREARRLRRATAALGQAPKPYGKIAPLPYGRAPARPHNVDENRARQSIRRAEAAAARAKTEEATLRAQQRAQRRTERRQARRAGVSSRY